MAKNLGKDRYNKPIFQIISEKKANIFKKMHFTAIIVTNISFPRTYLLPIREEK
jgi:hypothetical protein